MNKNTKLILAGVCGCIGILVIIGIVAVLVGGVSIGSFIKNANDIVSYNNELAEKRGNVIDQINKVSDTIDNGEQEDITVANTSLKSAITELEDKLNELSVPKGTEDLKKLHSEYVAIAKEASSTVDELVVVVKSEDVNLIEINKKIDTYNSLVNDVNKKEIEIGEKLNEIVGYEAISKEDLDSIRNNIK